MPSKKPEAVITDLDGSLLNDRKEIGSEDLKTIARLKSLGIPVFIASGRSYCVCRIYAQQIGTDLPVINCNGAIIYDFATEQPLVIKPIDHECLHQLRVFAIANDLCYHLNTENDCIYDGSRPDSASFQIDRSIFNIARPGEWHLVDHHPDFDGLKVVKLMIPDCTTQQYRLLMDTPVGRSGQLEIAFSGNGLLDINAAGVSKGTAAQWLSQKYGFSLENTLAMGDNENDACMLGKVGYSVVPATAAPEIRALGGFVTCSNNDNPITHAITSLFPGLL